MSDPNLLDLLFLFYILAPFLHCRNLADFQKFQALQYAIETQYVNRSAVISLYNLE